MATRYLRIVPGRSLLGFELGRKMRYYLGSPPWNSVPRQVNIWGDPVLGVWGDDLEYPLSAEVDVSLWGGRILNEVTLHSRRFGALLMETPTGSFMFKVGMTLKDLLDGLG